MKKSMVKRLCNKALAAVTGAAVFVSAYAPIAANAADKQEYISEVFLSYGETYNDAKDWLEKNGYTVLDQDLNEDADAALSTKRSVCLGYKTTTDKDEAIRDMRAMNMNGNYSYDEYQKVLESKRSEINEFVENMKTALAEYRANYEKGSEKAKIAHDKMNQYLDDDCDHAGLGDLLLKPIKEEMTKEEYEKAPKEHVDMTTLVMQGNINNVNALMSDLSMAVDTADDSWTARLGKSDGIDGLFTRYENEYTGLSESALTSLIISEYDDQAKIFAEKLTDLRDSLKCYTECEVKSEDDIDKVKAYFEEHPGESMGEWSMAGTQYSILAEVKYEDGTLADIVTGSDYDFDQVDDRMALYPVIASMSEGQRALLPYVDAGELVITGNLDADGWKKSAEEAQVAVNSTSPSSIYQGVDRTVFDPAGVALTSEARQFQSATGADYSGRLFGENSTYFEIAGAVTSAIVLGIGIGSLVHAGSLKQAASEAVRGTIEAANTLAEKTTAAADQFYKFITINKNIALYETRTGMQSLLSYDRLSSQASAAYKKVLFETFANANDFKNVQVITQNGVGSQYRDNVSAKKLYKEFCKDSRYKKVADEYELANQNVNSEMAENLRQQNEELSQQLTGSSRKWRIAGTVLCIAGALLAIGTAAVTIYDIYKYYHQDYAPIPRKIVHESSDEKGRFVYTMYDCTLCNREEKGFGNDKLGSYGDMNGDVGKQWLALYTTKDKAAGDPITADIIAQKGSNKFPADKNTTVRLFGQTDSLNIVSEKYGYNDGLNGLYIFSSTAEPSAETDDEQPAETPDSSTAEASSEAESVPDTSSEAAAETSEAESSDTDKANAAGSVVGTGTLIASCTGSAAIGALICFFILRKKKTGTAA